MFSIINRINNRDKGRTRSLNTYNNMFVYSNPCQFQLITIIIHEISFSVSRCLLFGLSCSTLFEGARVEICSEGCTAPRGVFIRLIANFKRTKSLIIFIIQYISQCIKIYDIHPVGLSETKYFRKRFEYKFDMFFLFLFCLRKHI